jgi:hypothetical protein
MTKFSLDDSLCETWLTVYCALVFQIVTRSGVPTETEDLRRCSAAMARAIILLSPAGLPPHEADALVRTYFSWSQCCYWIWVKVQCQDENAKPVL